MGAILRLLAVCLTLLAACGDDNDRGGMAAPTPTAVPEEDFTLATLNILHGLTCPAESANCRMLDRVALFFQWIVSIGCPDVVTVQEVLGPAVAGAIAERAASDCPFAYQIVTPSLGQNIILSRHPVVESDEQVLLGGIRLVVRARIDHPLGLIDVFTTHLAAGIDMGSASCREPCPEECVAAGAVSNRDCQAAQLVLFVERTHDLDTPAVVTGDFNATPETFVYAHLIGRGWIDAYLAAGNPECDGRTGIGCTSGREDENLSDLESPQRNTTRRIDYAFVVPPAQPGCEPVLDTGDDADGDGVATRLFADEPNPFAPSCGPLPEPICWPSDHGGMQIDLTCAN
jgi:endonuclease/exonuclease/phosphatase family metal-dependent hydrolase